tara:strand:+ start:8097 stop:8396 length:300 start_codon:yes stop_codon:yes gene_type:complete
MSEPTISDKSHFKISLPMAIQAVGLILVLVYGYRDLESRIKLLEVETNLNSSLLTKMEELQDAPIPSDIKQDELIKMLDARINGVEDDLEYFKRQLYNK